MNAGEFVGNAVGDFPLLAAGVHEQQILLPVVVKAEIAARIRVAALLDGRERAGLFGAVRRRRADGRRRSAGGLRGFPTRHNRLTSVAGRMGGYIAPDAIQRIGGDAPPVAQAGYKLSVVYGGAPEGRFGEASLTAIIADFVEKFLGPQRLLPRPVMLDLSDRLMILI